MPRTRVLYVIDTGGAGGAETVLINLLSNLPPARWQSRTVIPLEGWLCDELRALEQDFTIIPSRGSVDVRFLASLIREIRVFRPALIHCHLLTSIVYATLASSLSNRVPLVCTFHGRSDVKPNDRFLGIKTRILSRERNAIVYVSRDLRYSLETDLGIPSSLGTVIHNGIRLSQGQRGSDLRGQLGLDDGAPLVGCVGNFRTPKDYPNLLRAARLVLNRRPDAHFVVVGEDSGPLADDLRKMRDQLDLASRVHFLGFRKDVSPLMAEFDIFASSSASEGLPLATLEALQLGLPCVLTRVGGVPEIVEDGETALLVPPKNPEALARGILTLLDDRNLAIQLGSAARVDVGRRFSLDSMVGKYERLYEGMISRFPVSYA